MGLLNPNFISIYSSIFVREERSSSILHVKERCQRSTHYFISEKFFLLSSTYILKEFFTEISSRRTSWLILMVIFNSQILGSQLKDLHGQNSQLSFAEVLNTSHLKWLEKQGMGLCVTYTHLGHFFMSFLLACLLSITRISQDCLRGFFIMMWLYRSIFLMKLRIFCSKCLKKIKLRELAILKEFKKSRIIHFVKLWTFKSF